MKSPLTELQLIQRIIRVNHAGEYAAMRIYNSQAKIFRKDKRFCKMINHMKEQERHHLEYFEGALDKHNLQPTKLLPLWTVCSTALGCCTAMLGKKAAMACTVAVEEVISNHYEEQISELNDSELKDKIKQFRQEEIEHHDIAIEHHAKEARGYKPLSSVIKFGCKIAIALSKRL